jgi:hypothetical protein
MPAQHDGRQRSVDLDPAADTHCFDRPDRGQCAVRAHIDAGCTKQAAEIHNIASKLANGHSRHGACLAL